MMKRFIFPLIVAIVAIFLAFEIYQSLNPVKAKSTRLDCHSGVVVFERVYQQELVESLQNAIKEGAFTIDMQVERSVHMPSQLFEHIGEDEVYDKVMQRLEKEAENKSEEKTLQIGFHLYENDKDDPKKKNEEAKKYAGYLGFRYFLDSVEVYRFQIDFMDMQAKDIDQRIDCAVESVMSL